MIAGPNGSGKSTLMELLKTVVNTGFYINPDDIEASLLKKPILHFEDFDLKTTQKQFIDFVNQKSTIGSDIFKKEISKNVLIQNNVLVINNLPINSYTASLLTDFLRTQLLKINASFTFETVMSHPSKIDFIDKAVSLNYRTYLYFITTSQPSVNIERIKSRIKKGGHNVSKQKIIQRFYRSIQLLPKAIKKCDRAFIFDNSTSLSLIAEFKKGKNVSKNSDFKKFITKITGN
jgi:predicted ABC-type ATPase